MLWCGFRDDGEHAGLATFRPGKLARRSLAMVRGASGERGCKITERRLRITESQFRRGQRNFSTYKEDCSFLLGSYNSASYERQGVSYSR